MSKQSDIKYLVSQGLPKVFAIMATETDGWRLSREHNLYMTMWWSMPIVNRLLSDENDIWFAILNNISFFSSNKVR